MNRSGISAGDIVACNIGHRCNHVELGIVLEVKNRRLTIRTIEDWNRRFAWYTQVVPLSVVDKIYEKDVKRTVDKFNPGMKINCRFL